MGMGTRLLLIVPGLIVLGFGGRNLRLFWTAWYRGFRTVGAVIDHERSSSTSSDGGSGWVYAPVVRFTDEHGEHHVFTGAVRSGRPDHTRGDEVPVVHPPGRPDQAMIASRAYAGWALGFPLLFGLGFVLLGLLL